MGDFVQCYLDELRALRSHGPYCLAGFSFGGRVAFVGGTHHGFSLSRAFHRGLQLDWPEGGAGEPTLLGGGVARDALEASVLPVPVGVDFDAVAPGQCVREEESEELELVLGHFCQLLNVNLKLCFALLAIHVKNLHLVLYFLLYINIFTVFNIIYHI